MFSSFQNSIQHTSSSLDGQKTIYVKLEESDQEPGRFWLKLIASLRIIYPGIGKEVLDSLVDNHSFPTAGSLNILAKYLKNQPLTLIMDNVELVSSEPWWQQTQTWMHDVGLKFEDKHTEYDLKLPTDQIELNQPPLSDMYELREWLNTTGEWLVGIHWLLNKKEFEEVGEILEQHAEQWLDEGFDPLELLFWLREIPSVLLTARPILCWLAAKACKQLDLPFLVNYYTNAAENSLASFTRFSRDPKQWSLIELNETGVTIGDLNYKLSQLK